MSVRSAFVLFVAAITLAGCASPAPSPDGEQPASPVVVASEAPPDAAELDAQRFRTGFALRSDLAWIRAVAADPSSDRKTFGVPLTADEVVELQRRSSSVEELKDAILPYALAQPDYAGAWIDHDRGGLLVVQFSGLILPHQAAILHLTRPGARYEIRRVRWSEAELEEFADRIRQERDWFETIPAYVYGSGQDVVLNRVSIELSSADPALADKVKLHFGWTDEIVIVHSDGTGALLLQKGSLTIRAIDSEGLPVPGLACVAISDIDGANESRPLPMPTTDEDGFCTLEVAASGYTIHLERGHGPPKVVAVGRATVKPKKLTEVTITVP